MNRRTVLVGSALGVLAPLRVFAVERSAEVGRPAPPFRLSDAEGAERKLSDFAGKAVVLEWTSPSCPFVRAQYESGVMQELQRMAAQQGVAWLTILSTHPVAGTISLEKRPQRSIADAAAHPLRCCSTLTEQRGRPTAPW